MFHVASRKRLLSFQVEGTFAYFLLARAAGDAQGTVIRSGAAKMLEVSREYRCQNKTCGAVFSVHSDMSQGNLLAPPVRWRGRDQLPFFSLHIISWVCWILFFVFDGHERSKGQGSEFSRGVLS